MGGSTTEGGRGGEGTEGNGYYLRGGDSCQKGAGGGGGN